MAKPKDPVKITLAAMYFAQESRDINKVAAAFQVSTRTIRRWSTEEPEWERALKLWDKSIGEKLSGTDRSFKTKPKRDPRRDTRTIFEKAEKTYKAAIEDGVASHKLASTTAGEVGNGLTRRRVFEWAKVYGWRERDGPQRQEAPPPDEEKH